MSEENKPGRKSIYGERMTQEKITMTDEHKAKAKRIGAGEKGLAGGVRKAIEAYEESDSAKDNQKAG
jgi:hypothetical protein